MFCKNKILVVDDEVKMLSSVREILENENYIVDEAADGFAALEKIQNNSYCAVILDINLPYKDGLEVLKEIKTFDNDLPVIMFTAFGSNERIINAMKMGAFDYIDKPFELDDFIFIVNRAVKYTALLRELKSLKQNTSFSSQQLSYDEVIGSSYKMKQIYKLIGRAAPTDVAVLIEGESGTGKEIIADTIQKHSLRNNKPYIKINCAAIPDTLLESELFGYEKGAFTDASARKIGRFELADGGTVFLDEINNMSLALQTKLLRFLQHKTFERVGGTETISVDVRIISATNKNIEEEVKHGNFREDLFYRLNVIHIKIPPLREHKEDIPLLVDHFIQKHSNKKSLTISDSALELLLNHQWQGNIRELENVIQRALIVSQGSVISKEDIAIPLELSSQTKSTVSNSLAETLNLRSATIQLEKELILKALKITDGNKSKAAELLGINRRQLFTKLHQYGITYPSVKQ
uniref:Sigma-54-dependent Fis family transcriptional regulator n=1 Tax=Ignavibacterium album TaxID=591197 RepID=A0A832DIQ8_9BACT